VSVARRPPQPRRLVGAILAASALALIGAPPAQANPSATEAARGRVLAAGDSMIQVVDGFLKRGVGRRGFRLKSDAHVGTGLSKSFLLPWVTHSRRIARRYRPTASVVFLGANEGFPMRYQGHRVECCKREWRLAYSARARAMMRALERRGRSRVYWLTLPAARAHRWNRIYRAVNDGLEMAAAAEGDRVRLLDMGRIFTPGGRFRQTIVRGGRRVSVRQRDGIHLNVAGARIAAQAVLRRMRRDHLFR
jgi:hypothetical protein